MLLEQKVRDIMTPNPVCMPKSATIVEVARQMNDHNIGDVIIVEDGVPTGITTDRDIVVRVVAQGLDPNTTTAGEAASGGPVSIGPDEPADNAVALMRQHALRRLPVCDDNGTVVGVLSIGDLATERDPESALADISAAPPNN